MGTIFGKNNEIDRQQELSRIAEAEQQRSIRISESEHLSRNAKVRKAENLSRVAEVQNAEHLSRIVEVRKAEQLSHMAEVRIAEAKQQRLQRLKNIEAERFNKVRISLINRIDLYVRTRSNFDSRIPRKFRLNLSLLTNENDIVNILNELNNGRYNITMLYFVMMYCKKEFTVHDNNTQLSLKFLTPFQGGPTHRVFGYFECFQCGGRWKSAATWANKWQKCKQCESMIYPFQQHPLEIREEENAEIDNRRPHDMARCQRCIELAHLCLPSIYYSSL
eukprot:gene6866-9402_t